MNISKAFHRIQTIKGFRPVTFGPGLEKPVDYFFSWWQSSYRMVLKVHIETWQMHGYKGKKNAWNNLWSLFIYYFFKKNHTQQVHYSFLNYPKISVSATERKISKQIIRQFLKIVFAIRSVHYKSIRCIESLLWEFEENSAGS